MDPVELKPLSLKQALQYQSGAVVSKEIIKTSNATVTIFAFDTNQGLSEHTTPFTALLQVIDGQADVTVNAFTHNLKEGDVLILPANQPHGVVAKTPFKMVLTMLR